MSRNELTELSIKIVNLDLIEIKDKVPVANTSTVDEYIKELTAYVDDAIDNDLDVEVIESKIKEIKSTYDGFMDFRKSFTTPLDGIKKEFTSRENKIDEQRDRLIKRKEEMLETTYKIAEEAIKSEFEKLQESNEKIVPDMTVFDSFVSAQRKVKGMLPNEKGVLGKASLEKIEKEFEKHIAPIREAKALEELREKEQKQFEMYLENLNVKSDNIPELEAVIVNLEQFKNQVAELYPNIVDSCIRTLDNKIGLAKSNINTLHAMAKQKEAEEAQRKAEEEAKQAAVEVKEVHTADDEILKEIEFIKDGLGVISDNKDLLNEKLDRLRVLTTSMRYATTLELSKEVATTIKNMITDIEKASLSENKEIVSETFTVHGTVEDMKALVRFLKERGMSYE